MLSLIVTLVYTTFYFYNKTTTIQTHIRHIYSNRVRQCILKYSSENTMAVYKKGVKEDVEDVEMNGSQET